jgi:hypothetical protein
MAFMEERCLPASDLAPREKTPLARDEIAILDNLFIQFLSNSRHSDLSLQIREAR